MYCMLANDARNKRESEEKDKGRKTVKTVLTSRATKKYQDTESTVKGDQSVVRTSPLPVNSFACCEERFKFVF